MRQDCITPEVNGALTHIVYLLIIIYNAYNNIIIITFKASHYNHYYPHNDYACRYYSHVHVHTYVTLIIGWCIVDGLSRHWAG